MSFCVTWSDPGHHPSIELDSYSATSMTNHHNKKNYWLRCTGTSKSPYRNSTSSMCVFHYMIDINNVNYRKLLLQLSCQLEIILAEYVILYWVSHMNVATMSSWHIRLNESSETNCQYDLAARFPLRSQTIFLFNQHWPGKTFGKFRTFGVLQD